MILSSFHISTRCLTLGSLAGIAALLGGCASEPQEATVGASPEVLVHGSIPLDRAAAGHRVALVWTYWPEELCETSPGDGVTDFGGSACEAAFLATEGIVETTTGGFRLVQAEPPPPHVHGMSTPIAEAVIVEIPPEVDLQTITIDDATGVDADHLVVWVPAPVDVDRIEAQEVGGVALDRGFYLVRAIDDGPQVEGSTGDGGRAITMQKGVVVRDEALTVEPIRLDEQGYRVPFAPQLFL